MLGGVSGKKVTLHLVPEGEAGARVVHEGGQTIGIVEQGEGGDGGKKGEKDDDAEKDEAKEKEGGGKGEVPENAPEKAPAPK